MSTPEDPERFADGTPRSALGELFASATRDLPSDEQITRLAAQLGPILDAPPSPPKSSTGISGLVKLGVVAGAVAALVGGGLAVSHRSHPATVPPTAAPKATPPSAVSEALPTPPPSAPPEPPSANSDEGPSHAPDQASSASSKPAIAPAKALTEAALLEQARRALNTSPSYALQLANQHRARFPNGVLSQEREVIAIDALRRLHRGGEAEQRASGFSKAFPGSAHQRMVDEAAPK